MTEHPYKAAPDSSFWKRSVSSAECDKIDPVIQSRVSLIEKATRVVSAGSCFAANIAKYLRKEGFNYIVTENMHTAIYSINPGWWIKLGYGAFSAHYGNIYTPLQMYQLLLRAYGHASPLDDRWMRSDGAVIDPFRPTLPYPASSDIEFVALRDQHFAAVRDAFESAEVFIFTLGLTEAWRSLDDGFVFPVCPGTIEGTFDPTRHAFVNFGVDEIVDHIEKFSDFLRQRNPELRIILTVSPVPLVATATNKHVIQASVYSKSVLRVAAEMAVMRIANMEYFPAYEIIAGPQSPDNYFEADRRTVSVEGIEHVMRIFFAHFTSVDDNTEIHTECYEKDRELTLGISQAIGRACEEELVELSAR